MRIAVQASNLKKMMAYLLKTTTETTTKMNKNVKLTNEAPLEQWEIEKLIPYENNPKLHNSDHINKLASNIEQNGITNPIVVDENGVIIGGHGRRLAAMRLGMKFVPVRVLKHLTPDQTKAMRLSDNRVVGNQYDENIEHEELLSLLDKEIDLTTLGYDDKELEFMTIDLTEMDMSSLVEDLDTEVRAQTKKTDARTEAVESEMVSIGDAIGFKSVTVEQARNIGTFIGELEQQSGKKGAEAFDEFVLSLISDS